MAPTRTDSPGLDLDAVINPLRDVPNATNGPAGPVATKAAAPTEPAAPAPVADGGDLPERVGVVVIGGGFGGVDAAVQLAAAGERDFVVLDRADGPAGCWRANTYPGIACDVPSNLYSFSYAPNPAWSRTYSSGGEIRGYIEQVAADYGALPFMRFGVSVTAATWLEDEQQWQVDTDHGVVKARFLISATGPLTEPIYPEISGRRSFEGIQMHSARWDHDVDLTGKRIAVIGTGASAIQFVPELTKIAGRLDIYQRTAPWVLPRTDRPTTAIERQLFRVFPSAQRLSRRWTYAARELLVAGMRGNRAVRGVLQALGRLQLRRQVSDPALRATLTPDFEVGCKRILLSNTWYPALTRRHVNVISDRITQILPHGVVTADGTYREVDAIVYGTGFHVTDPPMAEAIRGAAGETLAERWHGSPQCYLGTAVDGFPNMFMLVGPNSGVGHTSILLSIEWQVQYAVQAITAARREGIASYSLTPEAMQHWVREIDELSEGTVWLDGGCSSYYIDATGRNSSTWPTYTWKLRDRLATFDPSQYAVRREAKQPASK